ncbi:SUKH-4 family immunity protein [Streptomyces griseoviridis]|uniref:Nucleic acid/nucleotide deaminase of polymorphic system toxin n=1 Tax=Streptomyces griseoviridis TaxID=45398 RepID=A0ABT9LEX2_STRGD|nr:SUKH-4 family immunity protein [Streptomyces griseoviridis]MDP9682260.1 hypothetical protein [Streptomyces griseoviridis]GGS82800.1 hypothetical protein GCM10010240_15270 [Streptomyces griseoviridis]
MVTFAQAQERGEEWINGDVPASLHREVRVREFGLGFVVWGEDRAEGPAGTGGAQRLVLARDSGEASLWPALPVGEVIRRYEEEYGRSEPVAGPVPAARVDLNQTSFLLSPPEWLQEAADKLGIADRREGSGAGRPEDAGTPGASGVPGVAEGVTPWAGTDTNGDGGEDRSVPLPETVFASPVGEESDGQGPGSGAGSGAGADADAAGAGEASRSAGVPQPPAVPGPPAAPQPPAAPPSPAVPSSSAAPQPAAVPRPPVVPVPSAAPQPTAVPSPVPAPQPPVVPGPPAVPQPPVAPPAPVPPGPAGAHTVPAVPVASPPPPGPAVPQPPVAPPAPVPPGPAGAHTAPTVPAVPVASPPPPGPGVPPPQGAVPPPGPPQPRPSQAAAPQAPAYGYPPPPGQPTVGPGYQAVLRYRAQDGSEQQLIRRSAPGTPHPEWQIYHELRAMSVPPDQVLELHTELESCELPGAYCARMIREQWPQARITSIAPYGTDHASRQQGMRELLSHQGELHQVADGPARPAPVRAPLPAVQAAPPVPPEGIARELAAAFGPGVFRFEQAAVDRQGVPPVVAHTLVVAGLPLDMGPFFWAQAQPGRPVPTLAELAVERGVRPASDAGSYLVVGSDFGKALCVQYGTANIVAVPVEAGPGGAPVPPQFVNTGLPEFARCLALLGRMWRLRFGLNQEQAGRWTVDFQAQLAALDAAALGSPESWWSVLLEQMWDGLL